MLYFYLILSVALVPLLNNFFDILRQDYSWWLVPLLAIGFFLSFVILHFLVVLISFALVKINSSQDKGAKYYRFLIRHTLPLIVLLSRVEINLTGKSVPELDSTKEMLFVCNHQHDFDPAVILSVFKDFDIGFIGKKEIYTTMPFIAKVMHKLYCLPIDRENDRAAAKTIIEAIKILKAKKASIAIFPEGYTSKECELLPFRNGAFKIAVKANVPIAVCAISGTRQIPKNIFRRKTVVDFKFIDVISPEEFENLSTIEIGNKIHSLMEQALSTMKNGLE